MKRAFKVVSFRNQNGKEKRLSAWLSQYPKTLPSYILEYPEGEYVHAPKNTIGIMCFKTLKQAEYWMMQCSCFHTCIIEVLYHCKAKTPEYIINSSFTSLSILLNSNINNIDRLIKKYKKKKMSNSISMREIGIQYPPEGCICLSSVFCLT